MKVISEYILIYLEWENRMLNWINSSDRIVEVLITFIEEIISTEKFLLVGESYGGYLAKGILAKMFERVSGLLLVCPVVVAEPEKGFFQINR